MESELLHLTILSVLLLPCQQTFTLLSLFTDTGLATVKVQLEISVDTLVDSFFCFLDCSDLSCDVVLGHDWFAFVSHVFRNATITLSETGVRLMEQGAFFPGLVFDERNLNLQLVVAEYSMDCNANPYLIDPGVIGPGATLFDYSDIGPSATLSCSSSLISSKIPSVNSISHETCYAVSIPTNVLSPDFLTFIESLTRSVHVLLSIAQSHNITVPSKSVLDVNDVIHNLISEHISSGACQGGTDTEKRAPGLIFFFHQV